MIAVTDSYRQTSATAIFGTEFPQAYARSIVNRVLDQWKGQEDKN